MMKEKRKNKYKIIGIVFITLTLLVVGIFGIYKGEFKKQEKNNQNFLIHQRKNALSYSDLTNKIEYLNNDLDIKITNELDNELANVKLISHKDITKPRYVLPGKNRKVMIYEIETFEDSLDAIKGIEILNKNTGKLENKQYHLEYAIYDYVTKPIYISKCTNIVDKNGTKYEDCEQVVNGSYNNYEIIEWKNLYSKNLLKGNITIALVTDVRSGDYYDGVFTLFGKKIEKHAVWVDSYNTDILAYFTMDDNSIDSVAGKYNGTDTGITYGAGKIANGSKFSGLSSKINISNDEDFYFGTGEWTVNFWVNSTSPADEGFVGTYHYVDDGWMIYTDVGSQLRFRNGGDLSFASGYTIPGDTWVMITMTRNATHWSFYANGDLKAMNVAGLGLATNNENLTWGGVETNSVKSLTGSLDEAFFANRSWDASEILDLYNVGSGMTYVPSVSDALPSVTLNSPSDASTQFNLTISINCSATDDDEISNVSLYINGVLNKTQAGGTNFTELTQTYVAPSSGSYEWTCNAYDNASQLSWASSNFTVTIALNISGTLKYNNLTVVDGGDILITDQATNLLIANITTNSTGGYTYNVSSGMYLIQSYYPSTNASDPNLEDPDAESHTVVP